VDKATDSAPTLPGVFVRPLGRIQARTSPGLDTTRLKAQMAQMAQREKAESSRQRAEGLKHPQGSLLLHSQVIETSR